MKLLRRASEAEVIAEFLKNEFYHREFQHDRELFQQIVLHGDTSNDRENALRRALLFRRRGAMWRELPPDTQWWEAEVEPEDIERIFVFPRAHWRKIAAGNFLLPAIVSRLRARASGVKESRVAPSDGRPARNIGEFVSRIQKLSYRLQDSTEKTAVLLVGTHEQKPMLVFEGNHRITAALLASPETLVNRFRVFFGCSHSMVKCCWYRTTLANLLRYAANRVRNLGYDREADVDRVLKELETGTAAYEKTIGAVAQESKRAPTNVS